MATGTAIQPRHRKPTAVEYLEYGIDRLLLFDFVKEEIQPVLQQCPKRQEVIPVFHPLVKESAAIFDRRQDFAVRRRFRCCCCNEFALAQEVREIMTAVMVGLQEQQLIAVGLDQQVT